MAEQVVNKILPARKDQLVNFVEKAWGYEEWIANSKKYCGKKLVIKKGFRCSMHQHKIKEETFYVASGKIFLEFEINNKKSSRVMCAGDVMHIKIGMWHRFTGLEDSEIFEFSTFHMDEDSYRREIGGAVNLQSLSF